MPQFLIKNSPIYDIILTRLVINFCWNCFFFCYFQRFMNNNNSTWKNYKAVVATFNGVRSVSRFFHVVAVTRTRAFLPQVYFSRPDFLPKPVKGKITVNMLQLIRNFGLFSGIVMSLKDIINHSKYCTAWLVLPVSKYSWYIIENIFWKKNEAIWTIAKVCCKKFDDIFELCWKFCRLNKVKFLKLYF